MDLNKAVIDSRDMLSKYGNKEFISNANFQNIVLAVSLIFKSFNDSPKDYCFPRSDLNCLEENFEIVIKSLTIEIFIGITKGLSFSIQKSERTLIEATARYVLLKELKCTTSQSLKSELESSFTTKKVSTTTRRFKKLLDDESLDFFSARFDNNYASLNSLVHGSPSLNYTSFVEDYFDESLQQSNARANQALSLLGDVLFCIIFWIQKSEQTKILSRNDFAQFKIMSVNLSQLIDTYLS